MSVLAGDDVVLKYNKIGKKVKKLFSVEFDSQFVYEIYRQWNSKRKYSLFMYCYNLCWFCNKVRKRKLSSSQSLEQCKFRLKKEKYIDLFDDELEDSSDESETEAEGI